MTYDNIIGIHELNNSHRLCNGALEDRLLTTLSLEFNSFFIPFDNNYIALRLSL